MFIVLLTKEGRQRVKLQAEMSIARRIQVSLLPSSAITAGEALCGGDHDPRKRGRGRLFRFPGAARRAPCRLYRRRRGARRGVGDTRRYGEERVPGAYRPRPLTRSDAHLPERDACRARRTEDVHHCGVPALRRVRVSPHGSQRRDTPRRSASTAGDQSRSCGPPARPSAWTAMPRSAS